MTTSRHRALRARLTTAAAIVGVLSVLGTGTAWAAWKASDAASSTAGAATIGVQTALASAGALDVTYSSTVTGAATIVTITNSSSREGTYALAVSATGSAGMRGAVTVQIGTTGSGCTAGSAPADAVSGALSGTVQRTGSLGASASVSLCVRTSMTSAGVSAQLGAAITGTIAAGITVGTWTANADALTFAQKVVAPSPAGSGWYFFWSALNPALCLEAKDWGSVIHQAGCSDLGANTDYNELWRFQATTDGYHRIQSRINGGSGHWYVDSATAGASVLRGTTNMTAQSEWMVTSLGSGYVQISSRANPLLCIAIEGGSASTGAYAKLATCDPAAASQRFQLDLLEVVVPPPTALTCTSDGHNVSFSWPALSGYQQYVVYRVKVGGVVSTVHGGATGWDPVARFGASATRTAFGNGTHDVVVEQSVMDGPWTVTGTGRMQINGSGTPMSCR